MTPREKAIEWALGYITKIDPTGLNTERLRKEFEAMTDEQFAQLMDKYLADEERIPITAPNFGKTNLNVKRNLKVAEELGHSFYQQVVYHSEDPDTPSYVGPPKLLVMDMPYRRTAQLLVEGISVAKHNNSIDQRTGAVTGASAASKLSGPEQNVLYAMNMVKTIEELASARGGDAGRWQAMEASFQRTGKAALQDLEYFSTGPESFRSFSSLLTAMHIANNG